MFVGRKKELKHLQSTYMNGDFAFTVIYGRRRIGKTQLLIEYLKDKKGIYYMATETSAQTNLQLLSEVVFSFEGKKGLSFADFHALFDHLKELSKDERVVFVIDEYPYLAQVYPEISSIIQKYCDHEWNQTKLHLILCGSSMSFMEEQVLGQKSPLYGRRTSQIKLLPFTFFETEEYLFGMDKEAIAILHCATGGVAEYLSYIKKEDSLKENIINLFFKEYGRLYEEPMNYLKQELREPKVYNNILNAIANGASKNSDIANKAQLSTGALNRYIDNLISLGIVMKETPVLSKHTRKSIYLIKDGAFRFWYRYVLPNTSAIELDLGERLYNEKIEKDLPKFMGQGFEQIFFDVFDELNQTMKLPVLITERGRWWGNNPKLKREEEIDLVGVGDNMLVFAEVKWNKAPVDAPVILDLIEKSKLFEVTNKHYIIFSKNGFTEKAEELASSSVQLLSFLDAS